MKGSLNLALTKVIKGKYSFNYYEKCQKFRNQKPFKDPLNEHFISHNILLFMRIGDYSLYQTDTNIIFSEVPYLSSLRDVLEHYGKPNQYSIHKVNDHILSIVAFNNKINAERSKTILYLIDNKLIIGEYLFHDIEEKKFKDIFLHYIFKKYMRNEISAADVIYIEDKNKNLICINWNGFDLSIKYMCSKAYDYLDDFKNFYNTTWKAKLEKDVGGIIEYIEIPGIFV
jgi:hypothetical protein